ncbi:DinB family protein [Flexivirga sp. B27]
MTDTSLKATTLAGLQSARAHVLDTVDGLAAADLHRAMLPSGWSMLGLVNHLTVDVERLWFNAVTAADPAAIATFDTPSNAWHVPPDTEPEVVLAAYRDECARADRALADAALDAPPTWWPRELFGEWRMATVGEVVLHAIVETASHAGHLDAARELIDGHQWLVLD